MKITKMISIFLSMFLFVMFVFPINITYAIEYDEIGDADENGIINAIDLVILRKYLLDMSEEQIDLNRIDIFTDGFINILDFIRLKKYISGAMQELHINNYEKPVTWLVPTGEGDIGFITAVGYRIYTHSYVYTDKGASRYIYKVIAFAGTDRNLNPEYNLPTITVGDTKINDVSIDMRYYDNMLTEREIWDSKINTSTIFANEETSCWFITSCMLNGALYPLATVENLFNF
ncbi:MAG: dockerin type I repeat-containing protein [Clostridia bacterium]|nr:dockerin type I repeat-containing protein [Clostridia bacterium]